LITTRAEYSLARGGRVVIRIAVHDAEGEPTSGTIELSAEDARTLLGLLEERLAWIAKQEDEKLLAHERDMRIVMASQGSLQWRGGKVTP
jgi:hypothetical protein